MPITHPRSLLDPGHIARATFRPLHQQVRAPTRGGNPGVASVGRDLWQAELTTRALGEREALRWEAWLQTLRGGLRPFRLIHPLRRVCQHYRITGYFGLVRAGTSTAFDGTCEVDSGAVTADELRLRLLPAGFVFLDGDLVSVTYASGLQALHRVVEAVNASGAGLATLTVEPSVVPGLTAGRPAQLLDPWCLATLDGGQVGVSWAPGRRAEALRFAATQVFL